MNKNVLVFAVALMAVAMLATPVMAAPAQKIPITAIPSNQDNISTEKTWITNGDIRIVQGMIRMGDLVLTIDGQPPLVGTLLDEHLNMEFNLKIGKALGHSRKCVWTFEGVKGFEGSFRGAKTIKGSFIPYTNFAPQNRLTVEQHGVFQGSGDFEGWTLKISMDWALGDGTETFKGFLLIP